MLAVTLGAVLVSATVALHIDETENIPKKRAVAVTKLIKKLVKAKGDKAKKDRKVGPCKSDPACVEAVLKRTKAEDAVFITVKREAGAKGKGYDLALDIYRGADKSWASVETSVPGKRSERREVITTLVDAMYETPGKPMAVAKAEEPEPKPEESSMDAMMKKAAAMTKAAGGADGAAMTKDEPAGKADSGAMAKADSGAMTKDNPDAMTKDDPTAPAPASDGGSMSSGPSNADLTATAPPPSGPNLLPWVVIGSSVVAGGVGVIFGLQSSSARDDAEANRANPALLDEFNDKIVSNGLIANILYGVSAAGVATGVTMLVLE